MVLVISRRSSVFNPNNSDTMKIRLISLLVALMLPLVAFAQVRSPAQVINQSTRGKIGTGADVLTFGMVVTPGEGISLDTANNNSQRFLIRGVGQKLATFGVSNPASDPKLTIFDSAGRMVAENDNWTSDVMSFASQVGAFPLDIGSKDAAILVGLRPGNYTIQVTDPTSVGREVLVELYTVTRDTGFLRLGNISVLTSNTPVILAWVTDGVGPKRFLVRAVGPGLSQFGIQSIMTNPRITVYNAQGTIIGSNDNWTNDMAVVFAQAGAFPLASASLDAAVVFTQAVNGPVSISVAGQDSATAGNTSVTGRRVLIEVYEVR